MASNDYLASVHPDYFLDQEGGDSNADMPVATYHPISEDEGNHRSDVTDDGTTDDAKGDDGRSPCRGAEPLMISEAGTEKACRTGRAAFREELVKRAWEMRRSESPVATGCRLLVRPALNRCSRRRMRMDMEEVKACRDLGLELPGDWTYEISVADRPRSACNSPARGWRGDDPRDVKENLKMWAHTVAAATASQLSSS